MNPFTHFLRGRRGDDDQAFAEFVAHWDRLEQLTIRVYRDKMTPQEAAAEFAAVWPWLRAAYSRWQPALDPYWRATRAAGAPTTADPFLLLLAKESADDIPGDWRAMQHLPAAREALNQYLLR